MSAPTEPASAPDQELFVFVVLGSLLLFNIIASKGAALTNFAGNAAATVPIGNWVGEFDRAGAERVPAREGPFDEATMLDDDHSGSPSTTTDSTPEQPAPAGASHA